MEEFKKGDRVLVSWGGDIHHKATYDHLGELGLHVYLKGGELNTARHCTLDPDYQQTDTPKEYDFINPDHYKQGGKEVIYMMLDIWGKEKLIAHCEMCAFKYRMRLGSKPDQPIKRDLDKAMWYEDKAKELKGI